MSARDLTSPNSARMHCFPLSNHDLSRIEWADQFDKPITARFLRHPAAAALPFGVAVAAMSARDLTSPDSARMQCVPLSSHDLSRIKWTDQFDKPDTERFQRHCAATTFPSGVAVATMSARDLTSPDSARMHCFPLSNRPQQDRLGRLI